MIELFCMACAQIFIVQTWANQSIIPYFFAGNFDKLFLQTRFADPETASNWFDFGTSV